MYHSKIMEPAGTDEKACIARLDFTTSFILSTKILCSSFSIKYTSLTDNSINVPIFNQKHVDLKSWKLIYWFLGFETDSILEWNADKWQVDMQLDVDRNSKYPRPWPIKFNKTEIEIEAKYHIINY